MSSLMPDVTIPGRVWTKFLEQESQLDQEHPGDVTLSAVVGEILNLIQEDLDNEDDDDDTVGVIGQTNANNG